MLANAFLTGLIAAGSASAAVHEVWYNITSAKANPSGLFERSVVGVNGTWPPPALFVNENDTVIVHATNLLDHPTAIHHHQLHLISFQGMYFFNTSYYDGAPGVTQCGIPPKATLTYEIPVSVDKQWGTYWWHAHVDQDYVDGLRAPFIIRPTTEVHQYDDEYTIVLSDWYNEQHSVLVDQFMNWKNPTGAEPVPDSAAIYVADRNGNYLSGFNENVTIPFEAGKTYRLRFINAGAFAMFNFWIDEHQMQVIEADGTDTDPHPVDYLGISVAQRYSVLVTAKNTTNSNYLLHANFDVDMFDSYDADVLQVNYTSTISYGASVTAAGAVMPPFRRTPDQDLVPSIVEASLDANREIELGVFFATFDDGINRAAFNNITFTHPSVPSLFTQLSMGENASLPGIYGPQTHAIVLQKGEIIDLRVVNWDGNAHPFHLHGHKLQIISVTADSTSNDTSINPPIPSSLPNPMRRDTINVPGEGGAVTLRFPVDNPGTWMFHCHISWHLTAGLAVIFIESPAESQQELVIPQVMKDQCAALGIPSAGNAVGKFSTTDLAGVARGPYPQVLGWRPKGIGALAGCIITALLGMVTVVWYALGGQLDDEELEAEVDRELEAKKNGGLIKRGARKLFGSSAK
ncbi:BQ5605_C008g04964 [Microbotryum silenes-dioicae]|uniref:BQ5605_C008g04964 protein n=1 Tax=Microbotryum silenes-dioicae TaxID=796604 RepID=A0A2X0P7E8_9BASI|nr:BQ5605_C008g04964 [Microbotryum silenes-dioicae]